VGHRRVIENYYSDVNNLTDLLSKLVNSYRLLIGGAHELNSIALAHKGDIEDSLKKIDKLGEIIDKVIETLEYTSSEYNNYCKLKSAVMKEQLETQYILNEIDNELKLKE
jgi:hypothetical protein